MDERSLKRTAGPRENGRKKTYRKPRLTRFGDLRTMTLAPTPAAASESGFTGPRRQIGGP